eukprot:CAMPEP_0203673660 /NCGR_PEP_ID=MMETSP0090-20130426/13485_1 /ASSEMBLY_ACC=CAM_ASM_001088 /TAXON_ID=426623 /ORGANISM="Chaetoceros affinis, Strain CCMP159" /LENGTH=355 /DNA_ID=CAMNT_0050539365 /DNA_START=89 /DNA_END=1156 /DNA_ORIENTATION=+
MMLNETHRIKDPKSGKKTNVQRRSVSVPQSITSISRGSYSLSASLQSITLPESVTSIGDGAFEYCSSLKSVTIPSSVAHIGEAAFNSCRSLKSINIPESVFAIRSSAFESCQSLESILIPDTVLCIEDNAFSYCSSLKSIAIPETLMVLGRGVFSHCDALEKRQKDGVNNHFSTELWLSRRFADLPLHSACYGNMELMTVDKISSLIEENQTALLLQDAMGMTPLHILSCNPTATPDLIRVLKSVSGSAASIPNVNCMSPVMMLFACKGLSYDHYFEEVSQGPSIHALLEQGLLCDDDLELLCAFDSLLLSQFDQMDERTGLYPLLTAATHSHSSLNMLYKLTTKCPVIMDRITA